MKAGTRLFLIEFREGPLPEGPTESVKLAHAAVLDLVAGAGFEVVEDRADILPYQTFTVFWKPQGGAAAEP